MRGLPLGVEVIDARGYVFIWCLLRPQLQHALFCTIFVDAHALVEIIAKMLTRAIGSGQGIRSESVSRSGRSGGCKRYGTWLTSLRTTLRRLQTTPDGLNAAPPVDAGAS